MGPQPSESRPWVLKMSQADVAGEEVGDGGVEGGLAVFGAVGGAGEFDGRAGGKRVDGGPAGSEGADDGGEPGFHFGGGGVVGEVVDGLAAAEGGQLLFEEVEAAEGKVAAFGEGDFAEVFVGPAVGHDFVAAGGEVAPEAEVAEAGEGGVWRGPAGEVGGGDDIEGGAEAVLFVDGGGAGEGVGEAVVEAQGRDAHQRPPFASTSARTAPEGMMRTVGIAMRRSRRRAKYALPMGPQPSSSRPWVL